VGWEQERASIRRDALGIAAYAGAFGISYGAVAVGSGLSVVQTSVLSLLMFSGASQVAFIGVVVTDEPTAMAIAREDRCEQRYAFWTTGVLLIIVWNLGTLIGALGGSALGDPATFGLDAIVPAAFLALLWPRLEDRTSRLVAIGGALVATVLVPLVPPGIPVLAAAPVAVVVGLLEHSNRRAA
jgi:predicted branched-subunit amino acid permease